MYLLARDAPHQPVFTTAWPHPFHLRTSSHLPLDTPQLILRPTKPPIPIHRPLLRTEYGRELLRYTRRF